MGSWAEISGRFFFTIFLNIFKDFFKKKRTNFKEKWGLGQRLVRDFFKRFFKDFKRFFKKKRTNFTEKWDLGQR